MSDCRNAEFAQKLVVQFGQHLPVNSILLERASVLAETERFEPFGDVGHFESGGQLIEDRGGQLEAMLLPHELRPQEKRMAALRGFAPYASGLVVPFDAAA